MFNLTFLVKRRLSGLQAPKNFRPNVDSLGVKAQNQSMSQTPVLVHITTTRLSLGARWPLKWPSNCPLQHNPLPSLQQRPPAVSAS